MPAMFDITIYMLAGSLVLIGWALCRLLPRVPGSGGVRGLRFWLALLLVVAFDRALNMAFFTVQTTLYDASDALLGLAQAALLYVLTGMALKQTSASV
jgi:hypothetical protein